MRLAYVSVAWVSGGMVFSPGWTIATYVGYAILIVTVWLATLGDLSE